MITIVLAVLAVAIVADALNSTVGVGERPLDALAWVCLALAMLTPLASWARPWFGLFTVLTATALFVAGRYPGGPIFLPLAVAVGVLAFRRSDKAGYLAAIVTAMVLVLAHLTSGEELMPLLLVYPAWAAFVVLGVHAVRAAAQRRTLAAAAQKHAEERRHTEERLAIARDLHDGLAHAMTVITVQAAAAERLWDREPARARESLGTIRAAGRDALTELNAALGLLRGQPPQDPDAPGDLDTLIGEARRTGAPITVVRRGAPRHDTVAYRLVQEALTNARKHSPGRPVVIELDRDEVRVRTTPPVLLSRADSRPGRGLTGMRERVEATGGQFRAGPVDGGFEVAATWPA